MTATIVLTAPSLTVTLGRRSQKMAEELEALLPGLRDVARRLEKVETRFCCPLLQTRIEELDQRFAEFLPSFTFHVVSAVFPLFSNLFLEVEDEESRARLKRLMISEKKFFEELKPALEEKASLYGVDPGSVVKVHAAVIDYDLWVISSVLEVGFDGFLRRLSERAGMEAEAFVGYLYSLFYVMMCIDLVFLGGVSYRRDTFEALVSWGSSYSEEVEDYLDTLSLLVSDEAYEALIGFTKG